AQPLNFMRFLRVWPTLLLAGVLAAQSGSVENNARAVIEAKCLSCHGASRMSDLDLRQTETILKGGKRGPAVVPGNADESLLYKAVRREGDLQMPPEKAALTSAEENTLRDWI